MNFPRLLMSGSAAALAGLGICGSLMPDQVLRWIGAPVSTPLMPLVQLLGALYLGFAVLDWMVRGILIGGIYGRPVVLANLLHFLSAGLAMIKAVAASPDGPGAWPLMVLYTAFATGFAVVLFRLPIPSSPAPAGGGSRSAPHEREP